MAEMEALSSLRASQIPKSILYNHLRVSEEYADETERAYIEQLPSAALSYICEAYGFDVEYADEHPEIALAMLAVVRDMYDNRSMSTDKEALNLTAKAILDAHDHNSI